MGEWFKEVEKRIWGGKEDGGEKGESESKRYMNSKRYNRLIFEFVAKPFYNFARKIY